MNRQGNEPPQCGVVITCGVAREAVSALIDGEAPPVSEAIAANHLARCRECREFRADAVSLTRQMRLQTFAGVPNSAPEALARLGCRDQTEAAPRPRGRARVRVSRVLWSRATQWAVGVVPLGIAIPALALGAFAHIHIIPTHTLSPCTMWLHHARPRWHSVSEGASHTRQPA
jgi:predicted anti-sigma-YlaC factor YlaD